MKTQDKGITLVALIITIIVLLILAVVSISAVTGSGLFSKTSDAVNTYQNSTERENSILDSHASIIDSYMPNIWWQRGLDCSKVKMGVKYIGNFPNDGSWMAVYENGETKLPWDEGNASSEAIDDGIEAGLCKIESNIVFLLFDEGYCHAFVFNGNKINYYVAEDKDGLTNKINNGIAPTAVFTAES